MREGAHCGETLRRLIFLSEGYKELEKGHPRLIAGTSKLQLIHDGFRTNSKLQNWPPPLLEKRGWTRINWTAEEGHLVLRRGRDNVLCDAALGKTWICISCYSEKALDKITLKKESLTLLAYQLKTRSRISWQRGTLHLHSGSNKNCMLMLRPFSVLFRTGSHLLQWCYSLFKVSISLLVT